MVGPENIAARFIELTSWALTLLGKTISFTVITEKISAPMTSIPRDAILDTEQSNSIIDNFCILSITQEAQTRLKF